MPWFLLVVAIATEVIGTLALHASNGFTQVVPAVVTVITYLVSIVLLALALKSLPVGIVYAIWSAVGIALVAILGRVIFGDPVPPMAAIGMIVIVGGVALVGFSGARTH